MVPFKIFAQRIGDIAYFIAIWAAGYIAVHFYHGDTAAAYITSPLFWWLASAMTDKE